MDADILDVSDFTLTASDECLRRIQKNSGVVPPPSLICCCENRGDERPCKPLWVVAYTPYAIHSNSVSLFDGAQRDDSGIRFLPVTYIQQYPPISIIALDTSKHL